MEASHGRPGRTAGPAPTHEEVGKALRLSKKKMGIVAKAIRVNNLTPHSENLEDDGPALDDVLTDDRNKGAETQLIESDDLDRIFEYLGSLEDREATVIRMRFGLDSLQPHDPARGRREPGPDPRTRPSAREPGPPKADARPG